MGLLPVGQPASGLPWSIRSALEQLPESWMKSTNTHCFGSPKRENIHAGSSNVLLYPQDHFALKSLPIFWEFRLTKDRIPSPTYKAVPKKLYSLRALV